jgi:type IV pilus assembly protein PilY1
MFPRFLAGALVAGTLVFQGPRAAAEDIDLFMQPVGTAGVPNVLIVLDNTANWSRTVDGQAIWINEQDALVETVTNLPVNNLDGSARFRVGLMLFTETGSPNAGNDGSYLRAAIRDLSSANKPKFTALLNSLDRNTDKSNNGKVGLAMAEAYRYFAGQAPHAGNSKVKTDYLGNTVGTTQSTAIYGLAGNALNSFSGSPYNSPVLDGSCGGNYIIYISNGAAQDNSSDISTGTSMLSAAAAAEGITGATSPIPISPSGSASNVADEWTRFMHESSLGVVTYTVDVDKITTGQGPGWSALLRSMAEITGGTRYDVTSGNGGADVADALGRIFSKIQAVNSVFASVSLPVSITSQSTFANQVFVGMFRPDRNLNPRWAGNLKQYKLGIDGGDLHTLDADDERAINSLTGFISECARSFWTPSAVDTYWAHNPQGACLAVPNSDESNYPDGNVVEKGGQGYGLRDSTTRTVQTCSPAFASCTALTNFAESNNAITTGLLNAANTNERNRLIRWQRGLDQKDEDIDGDIAASSNSAATEMRSSGHGDVVHGRPVAVDFGAAGAPQVVVFYGGNDGVLRAVNGNRSAAINGVAAGDELWAFVAPEFYGHIKRLFDNTVAINYTGAVVPDGSLPKPYGFDGPLSVVESGSSMWLYAAARRGGRFLYAFDVSGIDDSPATVSMKWKLGCPNLDNDTDCSSGFSEIGQTWSAPKAILTNGHTSGGFAAPMLIFGGGNDPCEDSDPHSCTTSAKGRQVYVLDANDGSVLKTFITDRPVVADVFVVPDGSTGLARYAYAVDMGGNIYRISGASADVPFGATAPSAWTMTKIASLGCDAASFSSPSADCAMNRKFMFMPDIVEKSGIFHILLGSGDREKPLVNFDDAYAVENYFFMVKDHPADPNWLTDELATCGPAVICLDSLLTIANDGSDPDAADLAAAKGWALALRDHEQAVTSAITVFGTTTFSTHTPTIPVANSCTSNLGTARVYNVRYANAAAIAGPNNRDQEISGGGLPPSPVAGMVELDDGTVVPFIIGGHPDSALESLLPGSPAAGTQPKSLTYWLSEK